VLPVADPWFAVRGEDREVTRLWEPHVHRLLRANFWHVRGAERDLVVDGGLGVAVLRDRLPWMFERDPLLVLTHAHCDHTGAAPEFADRRIHAAELGALREPPEWSLRLPALDDGLQAAAVALEPVHDDLLIDALPVAGYEPSAWAPSRADTASPLDEGEILDQGDRRWRVLHLPGHSPGSVGLLDEHHGVLLSGDALYDGVLLDDLDGSDVADYVVTIRRLRELDVNIVHAGHNDSFGADRLRTLCDAYLERRGAR
jgi:glyoxylase-like metal-dependent hydrolase (beta-lactamase superfamily II)